MTAAIALPAIRASSYAASTQRERADVEDGNANYKLIFKELNSSFTREHIKTLNLTREKRA